MIIFSMHICMAIFTYECVHAHIYIYKDIYRYVYIFLLVSMLMRKRVCQHVYVSTYACKYNSQINMCMKTRIHSAYVLTDRPRTCRYK
jgi:hypothetical protein